MNKELSKESDIGILIEEIKEIIIGHKQNAHLEFYESKWDIGATIYNFPLFKKGKHGQKEVYNALETSLGLKSASLHDCVRFYEYEPKCFAEALQKIELDGVVPPWRDTVKMLGGGEKVEKEKCGGRCDKCGKACNK